MNIKLNKNEDGMVSTNNNNSETFKFYFLLISFLIETL
jgi:hypothetical protein